MGLEPPPLKSPMDGGGGCEDIHTPCLIITPADHGLPFLGKVWMFIHGILHKSQYPSMYAAKIVPAATASTHPSQITRPRTTEPI